jgi:hypothetical protein
VQTIEVDDVVVVRNNESIPRTIGWNSREYVLSPDKPAFVPAACAFCWFGDPRSAADVKAKKADNGFVEFIPDRATEVRRLRIKYGALDGDEATFDGVRIPDVTITTAEGNEVITVLQDPAGHSVMAAQTTVQSQDELLAMVKKQQRQLDMLVSQMDDPPSFDLPDDDDQVGPPADDNPHFGPKTNVKSRAKATVDTP